MNGSDHSGAVQRRAVPVFSFSTTDWAERDRFAALMEVYGRTITRFDVEAVRDTSVSLEAKFFSLPGLGLADVTSSQARVTRTPRHIIKDDFILAVNVAGKRRLVQHGRIAELQEGDAVLVAAGEVSQLEVTGSRAISFCMPGAAIAPLIPDIHDRCAYPIRRGTPGLKMLTGYADLLRSPDILTSSETLRTAITHVYDLVAATLGGRTAAVEAAKLRGVRAARLREIRTDVEMHLGSESLTIASVAARHRLSVRYLQRLFEADGISFTEFVLERRLQRAYALLRDPRVSDRPIGIIAFESGFTNQPYFNRVFRARFNAAPSDVRAQARHDRVEDV